MRSVHSPLPRGFTAGQLALAWVMARGDDVVPIPGTERQSFLEENVAAKQVKLTTDELARLDAIAPAGAAAGAHYGQADYAHGESPELPAA